MRLLPFVFRYSIPSFSAPLSIQLRQGKFEPHRCERSAGQTTTSPLDLSSRSRLPMDAKQAAVYAANIENEMVEQTWNVLNSNRSLQIEPNLPVGPTEAPQRSIDELAAELKSHPFFATSLEDLGDDNATLDALRALAYEGTRAEIAENFREQGNESARTKDWKNAKEFYSKALAALQRERREDELKILGEQAVGWEVREASKESELKEKCLTNRSLCNLQLRNYRSCCLDCVSALEIGPHNVKAYYRLAQALYFLSKLEEAARAAANGLTVEPDNTSLLRIKREIDSARAVSDELELKRKAKVERQFQEAHVLKAALQARQIKMRSTSSPPDLEDAKITMRPDPLSPASTLVFPVLLLYPLHGQTDFIKSFGEEERLADHIDYLLPLPWDRENEYGGKKGAQVDAYLETSQGGLVKWGKKAELLRILTEGKIEVIDGVVKVYLVPKSKAVAFIEDHKRRKGK